MIKLNSYLTFQGNCEVAFSFYRSVFGGEFSSLARFQEMPQDSNFPIADSDKLKIMHISLPISEGCDLMGCDAPKFSRKGMVQGSTVSISVNSTNLESSQQIFVALSVHGKITMPFSKQFWNAYFGMCIDQFGVPWMVNCDIISS